MPRLVLREGPTWLVIASVYGGWLALTLTHGAMPVWVAVIAGAVLITWHASVQHEIIHGHPTRNVRINAVLGWPPLSLWIPYPLYRINHLRHHRDRHLTCPIEDPESFHVTAEAWHRMAPATRWLLTANQTLLGRLTLGPAIALSQFWRAEFRRIRNGDRTRMRLWAMHLAGVAAVLGWAVGVAGVPIWMYAAWVYGGVALLLLRSFAEHRALPAPDQRTAVVDHAPLLSLLFLNNNLHVAHHDRPGMAWFRLPSHCRAIAGADVAARGAGHYRGYWAVAMRYLVRPIAHPVHPAHRHGTAAATSPEVVAGRRRLA